MRSFSNSTFVLCALLYWSGPGQAQTYLGPTIGYEFSNIRKGERAGIDIYLVDTGFVTRSFIYGIVLEQQLSNKFYLSLNSTYSKKQIDAHIFELAPTDGFQFKYWRNTVVLKYTPAKNWYVGIGPGLGFITDVRTIYTNGGAVPNSGLWRRYNTEYAAGLVVGYHHKRWLFELSWWKGLEFAHDYSNFIKPIESISVAVNYLMKVPWINPGKRIDCPRF